MCYPSEKQSALTRYLVVINIFNINKYQPYININNIPLELAQLPLMSSQVISKRKVEHKYVFSFVISVIQIVPLHFLNQDYANSQFAQPQVSSGLIVSSPHKYIHSHITHIHTLSINFYSFTLSHKMWAG